MEKLDFALIIPLANEEEGFDMLVTAIKKVFCQLNCGKAYLIVDNASKDETYNLCKNMAEIDNRFVLVWAPENRNVVDAYLRGYKEAFVNGHEYIIEMDAGLSHDPSAVPTFLRSLTEGNDCAFGSRFINGGSVVDSSFKRLFLSKFGTWLSNILLGTRMADMTSGFIGFKADIVKIFLEHKFKSKAHFYQTELRFLLRYSRYIEVPIHYCSASPRVSKKAVLNALSTLFYYTFNRLRLV